MQVKYAESGQDFTLYIQAKSEGEKEEWIQLLRSGPSSIKLLS